MFYSVVVPKEPNHNNIGHWWQGRPRLEAHSHNFGGIVWMFVDLLIWKLFLRRFFNTTSLRSLREKGVNTRREMFWNVGGGGFVSWIPVWDHGFYPYLWRQCLLVWRSWTFSWDFYHHTASWSPSQGSPGEKSEYILDWTELSPPRGESVSNKINLSHWWALSLQKFPVTCAFLTTRHWSLNS